MRTSTVFDGFPGTDATSEGPSASPPKAVQRLFWLLVVYLNVGILLVSLGLLLAVFRAQYTIALALVVVGGAILAQAARRYRGRHEVFAQAD